ncbi:hypothetical protein CASFOL_039508 [Castilleja foliolosa]|uniref:pyruvate kinase n=1 Tax=Castilleja foliolosa TaxID=1961234 RepID=A0ABD3BIN4_9LAMI
MENDGANLEPQIEALLNVERQMRQAGDVAGTRKAVTDILQLCFDAGAWKTLTVQIVLISKRLGQLKQTPKFGVMQVGIGVEGEGVHGNEEDEAGLHVGPACCSLDDLEKLALRGMNVARLNMCHNTREWDMDVIKRIKKLNEEKGYCVSVMIDTEGSQIHVGDHGAP